MPDFHCSRCGRARYGSVTGGSYDRKCGGTGYVNDGGDCCTDCLDADPPFVVGQEIHVAAWWTKPKGTPVKCRVESYCDGTDTLDVRPLDGNPHGRFIRASEVIVPKENYRNEMESP